MSDYFRQNHATTNVGAGSWIILGEMETRIKEKIEKLGLPLKHWKIKINYGIKTGLNEAFIIDEEKRNELMKKSPKSEEIIRPILRGRDIQKFMADWKDLYIIVTHNGYTNSKGQEIAPINVDDYPEVKKHLKSYWSSINVRQDQGITPYNLRSCIYMEDFSKQKIVYPNMTKFLPFYFDNKGYFTNQKCFIITGENIAFLTAFFNSSLFKFCFKENFPELQGGTRELSKIFFDKIRVIEVSREQNKLFEEKILEVQKLKQKEMNTIALEKEIDKQIFNLYNLTSSEIDAIGFIEIT